MILADTSVWIDFLSGRHNEGAATLGRLIKEGGEVAIVPMIYTELLQGIRDDFYFHQTQRHLLSFPCFEPRMPQTYTRAAEIYRLCRRQGQAIRHSLDTLIAAIAIENSLPILHRDRDFDKIAVCTGLKIYRD